MPQPKVPPEALSWCIDKFALDCCEERGEMLQKAHEVEEVKGWHRAKCGAQMWHPADRCAPAPAGWPACRHCWSRKREAVVPKVFYDL